MALVTFGYFFQSPEQLSYGLMTGIFELKITQLANLRYESLMIN